MQQFTTGPIFVTVQFTDMDYPASEAEIEAGASITVTLDAGMISLTYPEDVVIAEPAVVTLQRVFSEACGDSRVAVIDEVGIEDQQIVELVRHVAVSLGLPNPSAYAMQAMGELLAATPSKLSALLGNVNFEEAEA